MTRKKIVPALLAMLPFMMCCCTADRKAAVPAGEYWIEGELANSPDSDSIVIGLYEDEGRTFKLLAQDTLVGGKYAFRDTVSATKKRLIMSDNRGFPGTWLEVWVAPGEYIEISGEDKLVKTWKVVSDIPEQVEENRFTACALPQQKELMRLMAAEYDWQRLMFIDHAGDAAFERKGWAKIDSIRKLSTPLRQEIWKKELDYMQEAPVSEVWMDKLLTYASMMQYKSVMPYAEEVKSLYARMPDAAKETDAGREITAYVYPPVAVGIGDMMADGDLYDTNDSLRHISEFKGKFILLDFWSSGCGPCVESIPEMEKVTEMYQDRLEVISISEDPKARWKEYVKKKGMGGNQWNELRRGRTGLAASYQVKGIPHYVLIAPDGKIKDVWEGYGTGSILQKMEKNLK
ncbi:TlpA disulfide reductase family protein [uncultured Bacteroides sp.]|uniref:TlpA family protein disulfide reductase n=1 Tax=uncultured Bacteroides sp. TaxID=162156 RepID=UPI0025F192F2|nr:TlpA disulfide reductase family protein [uncultured Bacteroides sp.]